MTCIVGIERDGEVWMGGDSALTDSATMALRVMEDEKIFMNDQMLIGCCSSLRTLQLMRYAFVQPDKGERKDDVSFLATDFMDAVRNMQREKGIMKREADVEVQDAHFLIGYNGRLYVVEDDHQVYRTRDGFAAIGCGSDLALGAMYALRSSTRSPEEIIEIALEAAETFSAGVKRPFHIMKLQVDEAS